MTLHATACHLRPLSTCPAKMRQDAVQHHHQHHHQSPHSPDGAACTSSSCPVRAGLPATGHHAQAPALWRALHDLVLNTVVGLGPSPSVAKAVNELWREVMEQEEVSRSFPKEGSRSTKLGLGFRVWGFEVPSSIQVCIHMMICMVQLGTRSLAFTACPAVLRVSPRPKLVPLCRPPNPGMVYRY